MKIAVLGASGFLGRKLVKELSSGGHEVTGFVLKRPEIHSSSISYALVSTLSDPQFMKESPYEVVINLAARRSTKFYPLSEAEVRKFTFEIPKEFILRTAGRQSLVINTSTYIQNFEGVQGRTVDSYGAAKQELSEFLEGLSGDRELNILDLFLFTLYGEGDRPGHLVPLLLDAARRDKELSLSPGNQLMNLVHVDDAVRGILSCFTTKRDFSYRKHFVWDEKYFSVRELVSMIESVVGVSIPCLWGGRDYSGHEMMRLWPIPMTKLPGFAGEVRLAEGIRRLWEQM